MRYVCWIKKDTDSHSEHVVLIAFLRQQWLRELASFLRLYKEASVGKVICRGGHNTARYISRCLSMKYNPCGLQGHEAEWRCERVNKETRLTNN